MSFSPRQHFPRRKRNFWDFAFKRLCYQVCVCACRGEELPAPTLGICHIPGQCSERGGAVWGDRPPGAAWPPQPPALPPLASPQPPHPPRAALAAGHPQRPWWPQGSGGFHHCAGTITSLGWGIQGGHCWECGKGGGSALLPILGVAGVAPLFQPESPNTGALPLTPSPCSFVAFPVPSTTPVLRGAHAPAGLGATSCSCGASAALAALSPVLTRNLSYLQGAYTTPGGLASKIFGSTVTVEQGCAFIGNGACY